MTRTKRRSSIVPAAESTGFTSTAAEGPALGNGRVQHALGVRRRRQPQLLRLGQVQVVVGEPVGNDQGGQVGDDDRKREQEYDRPGVRYQPAQRPLPRFRPPDEPVEIQDRGAFRGLVPIERLMAGCGSLSRPCSRRSRQHERHREHRVDEDGTPNASYLFGLRWQFIGARQHKRHVLDGIGIAATWPRSSRTLSSAALR